MSIASKLTKIVACSPEPLDAYTIAMMYWENEKYMWPTTEWHLHEPKREEFEKDDTGILQNGDEREGSIDIAIGRQATVGGRGLDQEEASD